MRYFIYHSSSITLTAKYTASNFNGMRSKPVACQELRRNSTEIMRGRLTQLKSIEGLRRVGDVEELI